MTKTEFIDVRGDGRIVLSLRAGMKNPKYQARIRVPGATGYRRVSTKCSDLREAERFALDLYEELYFHVKSGGNLRTKIYKSVFEEWSRHVTTMGGSQSTVDRVKTYSVSFFGQQKVDQITAENFLEYWQWRKNNFNRTSPTNDTLNRERTAILAMFKYCLERGYLTSLPKIPKVLTKGVNRRPTFSRDEWRLITRKMREWVRAGQELGKGRDRFILQQYVLILANTGMRIGEARDLRWRNLRTINTPDGNRLIGDVTGKTGRREVVFQKGAEDYVKRIFDLRKEELGGQPNPEEFIFLSRKTGSAYTTFKTSFNSMLKFAGIEIEKDGGRRTIYSLRHFYATQRLSEGTNPYLLAQQMGTSVEMLEKFYGHVMTSDVAEKITQSTTQKSQTQVVGDYPFEG